MNQLSKLATLIATIFALGFMMQSCSTAKIEQADLEGYWSLTTLDGEPVADAFKGSTPSLEFDFDKQQVSGSGGCNRYFGSFTLEGNVFSAPNLGATLMACAEENKEGIFLATLGTKGLVLSMKNGLLAFKNNNKTVLEFKKGEAPIATVATGNRAITSVEELVGSWTLTKIKGDDASKLFGEHPATLNYDVEGNVNGNAGCNNYRGKATQKGNTVTFGPLMSTKMACDRLEGEQTYTTILLEPVQGSIIEGNLIFSQKGDPVLEFILNEE